MKKLLLPIVFAVGLLAVGGAAQTYDRAKIWDKEIESIVDFDRRQTPPANAVLFIGSSSIRLWAGLRTDFPRVSVINRGFGGSHIEDSNFYFDKLVTPYRPRKIFLYAGENDITAGKTPEEVLADFRRFAALVRERSPRSKLYFISLKPSPSRWNLREKFERTNALVRAEIGRMKNARFVDVWAAMLGPNGEPRPEIYLADKLHMNEKGYAIWREIVGKELR